MGNQNIRNQHKQGLLCRPTTGWKVDNVQPVNRVVVIEVALLAEREKAIACLLAAGVVEVLN